MLYWIKIFSIVLIILENLYLKINTCSIWTEKKSCGTIRIIKNYKYKTLTNNNSLGVFNLVKPNHSKPNQTEIEKIVWIWKYRGCYV